MPCFASARSSPGDRLPRETTRDARRGPTPLRCPTPQRTRPPRVIDRITTRVSERLGIRYPILQAGMIWASGYKLAVACAEADILGTIGSAGMKPDLLRSQIRKGRALTKKRFAVNIPLLRRDATELLEIALEEGI